MESGSSSAAGELERLVDPWVSSLRSRSPHTARSYEGCVRRFLEVVGGDVTPVSVGAYLESLGDLSPASRAHHISAVRTFLGHAADQGVIQRSPRELLVRPKVEVTSFERFLTLDELRDLLGAAGRLSPRHRAACLALALTGIRVSELAQAEWRHLYRDPRGRLGLKVTGKGGRVRVVKIRDDLFRVLAGLRGSDELDARDLSPLVPKTNGRHYSTRGLHKLVADAGRAAGLRKAVSPHWLRHTHATLAADAGSSAPVIQQSLGHAQLETSQIYIHWTQGLEETTVDALPSLDEHPD